MTLTEFLRDRYDELEARWAEGGPMDQYAPEVAMVMRAQTRGNRQIVAMHGENSGIPGRETLECFVCQDDYPCTTPSSLTVVHESHPAYDARWRP